MEHTIQMAKLVKHYGFGFFLDFHYSDWWADPGHQQKPQEWESLDYIDLKKAVYEYTKMVLMELKRENLIPQLVQIGNEIRTGMLFPDGLVSNWTGLAGLINSGIRAVREVFEREETQIAIHLDQGGHYEYYKDWFDAAIQNGVTDFDIIALSYYPFWHGPFFELKNNLEQLVVRYGKKLLIAETAHAYQRSKDDFFTEEQEKAAGFSASPENQRKVIEIIENIIANVSDGMGLGFFYWEPFMRMKEETGGWGNCMALVDETGQASEGLKAIAYDKFVEDKDNIVKIYMPQKRIEVQDEYSIKKDILPSTLEALLMDGRIKRISVKWSDDTELKLGKNEIIGEISETSSIVKFVVELVGHTYRKNNLWRNGDFQDGLKYWNVNIKQGKECLQMRIDDKEKCFWFCSKGISSLELISDAQRMEKGTYKLSCEYIGDNTTGVEVKLVAVIETKEYFTRIFPQEDGWKKYEITDIQIEEGEEIYIGIKIDVPPCYGKITRFCLEKQE